MPSGELLGIFYFYISIYMPYYIQPSISRLSCIGNSLSSIQASLSSLDTSVYALSARINTTYGYAKNQSEFTALLADSSIQNIKLTANITVTTSIYIAPGKIIDPDGYKFIKGTGGSIRFDCVVAAGRYQIFQGFNTGGIIGPFGGVAFPEWWGLQTNRHDIAINAAIQSSGAIALVSNGYQGITISLAAYPYYIARPIDLRNSKCELIGQGSGSTSLISTSAWKNDETLHWETALVTTPVSGLPAGSPIAEWQENPVAGSNGNHSALIWMGSKNGHVGSTGRAMFSRVKGLYLNCGPARSANPLRHISGISSLGWIEEQSYVDDIVVTEFSGFGIGFPPHRNASDQSVVSPVVNYLRCTNMWITGGRSRMAMGIYTTQWCNNIEFSDVTIDCTLDKSVSSEYAAVGGGDPTIYPAPAEILDYMWIGVVAAGQSTFNRFHFEGMCIGYWCPNTDISNVIIDGANFLAMMDIANGAVYSYDGRSAQPITSSTVLTSNGTNPANNATITIGDVATGGKVYTFKTTLTPAEGEVFIGSNATTTMANLAAAINRTAGDGTLYKAAAAHSLVRSVVTGLTMTITSMAYVSSAFIPSTQTSTTSGTLSFGSTIDMVEKPPAGNTNYFRYSCGVLIAGATEISDNPGYTGSNPRASVTVTGLVGQGVSYILRDASFGQNLTAYGNGQFPYVANQKLSFYSRGSSYYRNTTFPWEGWAIYDSATHTPANTPERTFFVGPVY